ncbi:MAG: CHASE2 domain-containing protein, partial [Acidobacteria bacterium]
MVRPAPSEQRARRRIRALLIGAGAALVVWGASAAGWLEAAELWSWDARARLFARPAPAAVPIRLVVVDDRSLRWVEEELGFSRPWPRHLHARLVRFCRRAGARALIFDDLGFTEERGDAPRDQLLASSLRAAAPSTVALAVQTGDDFAGWPESAPPVPFRLAGLEDWRAWAGGDPFSRRGVLLPVAPLAAAAPILGHVDGVVDGGPVVRFIEPLRVVAGRPLPFLALAAAAAVAGDVDLRLGAGWLELAGRRLPLDRRGRAVLRYRAPLAEHGGHLYPALAAAYLLAAAYHPDGEAGRAAAAEIRDRYVIFGIGASGLGDDVFTPTAGLTRGLEIHATALDNLLGGDFMRPAGSGSTAALSLALALAAAVTAIDLRRLRAMLAAAVC